MKQSDALDLVAAIGLLILAAGIWLVFSLGWALVALGAGLYGSAVLIALKGSSDATQQAFDPSADEAQGDREHVTIDQ
jgi:multisubunit Na+/H+ antiporter MnhC subunit